MRLMILGGGWSQVPAIRRAKERSYEVLVADRDASAPGCALADLVSGASTFDTKAVLRDARRFHPQGLLTLGTDQPVLTCAQVSEALGLPNPLDVQTALRVTDKGVMKDCLALHDIPMAEYRILKQDFSFSSLEDFPFPGVIKPLDSQGQRGVFLVDSPQEIARRFPELMGYSRKREILLERFYPSSEITVNGWVSQGVLRILTVVDRVTRMFPPHIGICFAHRYPSRFIKTYGSGIDELSHRIVEAVGIKNGPVYFQFLMGEEGIKVNEIAARLGGAYEDRYMAFETGVDTIDLLLDASLGRNPEPEAFSSCPYPGNKHYISVPLIFTNPGKVAQNGSVEDLKALSGVFDCSYLLTSGTLVGPIENSTRRAAYGVLVAKTKTELNTRVDDFFNHVCILDEGGKNMLMDTRKDAYV